jgi:hypothetical protein
MWSTSRRLARITSFSVGCNLAARSRGVAWRGRLRSAGQLRAYRHTHKLEAISSPAVIGEIAVLREEVPEAQFRGCTYRCVC